MPCNHAQKEKRAAHLTYNSEFSEGHWEDGEGIRDREGTLMSSTIRWSEPYILSTKVGTKCLMCGEVL